MKKIVDKISRKIMEIYKKHYSGRVHSAQISEKEKELSMLSPGLEHRVLLEDYYVSKITNSIMIAGVSVVILVLTTVSRANSEIIDENNMIERREYGNGNYTVSLTAKTDEYDYGNVALEVEERKLTKSEYNRMIDEADKYIEANILGENDSLDHIDTEMNLLTDISGYPFDIRWESSDYMLIRNDGEFGELEAEQNGEEVILKAIVAYGEIEHEKEYPIVVFPHRLSQDQIMQKELHDIIKKENENTAETGFLKLPDSIGGAEIEWAETREPLVAIVILGLFFTVIAVWIGTDKDLKGKCEERDRQLLSEYSEFVSKLQLLLSSGLTIRGVLERMAGDYKKNKRKGGNSKYVYEELLLCVRKMQDGMNEAACYEFFGNRCGLLNYKKLASLLMQNLRKGNEGLIVALAQEANTAFEERKAVARRMGEEAQTKLLFPMVIMLGIVMVIIMIPAYMSFGGM